MDLAFFDFEHLAQLPGPRVDWPACHAPAGRSLERAIFPERMIEEGETEDESAFPVDCDIAPVANAPDKMDQTRFELFLAAPGRRVRP